MKPCRSYAIVVDLDPENHTDLSNKLALLKNLVEFIQGATPFETYLDDKYDDPIEQSGDFPYDTV